MSSRGRKITRCVEQLGHAVSQAHDGNEALSILRAQSFVLILLDLVMPEVDGFEVLRQLRQMQKLEQTCVIVITSVGESDSIEKMP